MSDLFDQHETKSVLNWTFIKLVPRHRRGHHKRFGSVASVEDTTTFLLSHLRRLYCFTSRRTRRERVEPRGTLTVPLTEETPESRTSPLRVVLARGVINVMLTYSITFQMILDNRSLVSDHSRPSSTVVLSFFAVSKLLSRASTSVSHARTGPWGWRPTPRASRLLSAANFTTVQRLP